MINFIISKSVLIKKYILFLSLFLIGCSDPQGACCIGGSCEALSRADCEEQGGKYFGDSKSETPCQEVVKDQPCFCKKTGVCCIQNVCRILCVSACSSAGGEYQGDGTFCDEDSCKPPPPSMEDLIIQMNISDSIFKQGDSGCIETEGGRRRILGFLEAIFEGDPKVIEGYLADVERQELSNMVKSGEWEKMEGFIDRLDFQCGTGPGGIAAVYIQAEFFDSSLEDTVWILQGEGELTRFEAVPMPPGFYAFGDKEVMEVLWEKLAELPSVAAEADEEIKTSPIDLTSGADGESEGSNSGGRGN
tara:strand:- start:67 stop:978 length:912 start_codon:yes stop_codon:yes gene_type:complete